MGDWTWMAFMSLQIWCWSIAACKRACESKLRLCCLLPDSNVGCSFNGRRLLKCRRCGSFALLAPPPLLHLLIIDDLITTPPTTTIVIVIVVIMIMSHLTKLSQSVCVCVCTIYDYGTLRFLLPSNTLTHLS